MADIVRCIICGGPHCPTAAMYCDEDGMEREAARMGNRLWNQVTGTATRQINRAARPTPAAEGGRRDNDFVEFVEGDDIEAKMRDAADGG